MAETALILGTIMSVGSSISQGIQQKKTADYNASVYDQQAANIAQQQVVNAEQYRIKKRDMAGNAAASAGASGVMVSGSVAKSISNSLTQLGIDENYNNFNLETQRTQAINNASLSRYQGNQSLMSGVLNAGASALMGGSNYYNKYWGNTTTAAKVTTPNTVNTYSGTAGYNYSWN